MFASLFLKRPKLYCDGCGFSMAKVRNVWRDCGKDYCSRSCLEITRLKAGAGLVSSPWYIGLATILAVFMLTQTFIPKARAQTHEGHAEHHDIYKSWTQSNGWSSCCNGDDPKTGKKGDCRPAKAYPDENGQWHVLINGKYRPVPLSAIRDYSTPDGNSHVCETPEYGVMCFVKGQPKS